MWETGRINESGYFCCRSRRVDRRIVVSDFRTSLSLKKSSVSIALIMNDPPIKSMQMASKVDVSFILSEPPQFNGCHHHVARDVTFNDKNRPRMCFHHGNHFNLSHNPSDSSFSIAKHDDDSSSSCRLCLCLLSANNAELFWNAAFGCQQSQSLVAQLVLSVIVILIVLQQRTIALARLWIDAIASSPNGSHHATRRHKPRTTTTTSTGAHAIGIGHGHGELGLLCRHSRLLNGPRRHQVCGDALVATKCAHTPLLSGDCTRTPVQCVTTLCYPFFPHHFVALTIQREYTL
jgi:hypothetical protein